MVAVECFRLLFGGFCVNAKGKRQLLYGYEEVTEEFRSYLKSSGTRSLGEIKWEAE